MAFMSYDPLTEISRYCLSVISECKELARLLMAVALHFEPILITRHILENDVFQQVGDLVS